MTTFWWETPLGRAALEEAKSRPQEFKEAQFESVLQQLIAAHRGAIDAVTPDTCMQSPTVHAIVTAISRRIAVSPVHVYRKTTKNGREVKERLPNHPVAKLLAYPNKWQSRSDYWMDAASAYVRHGKYFAWKSRGSTGPIRELLPLNPGSVSVQQDRETWAVRFRYDGKDLDPSKLHYVRGPARDFVNGDSPVKDVSLAIALEIAAERFGASFFENGAVPLLIFQYMQGAARFKTQEEEKQFIADFQRMFSGRKTHNALLLPKGIETGDPVKIENDKAQFLETRKYQRTVIAGAFGVPPHLVGDLERATFNNVEQQDSDFTLNVVMPVSQSFEAAMERDLLTDDDVNSGVVIRFNLDSILRADFRSRQEGLQIQRRNGVISVNEWREIERMNPISKEDGGEDYIHESNMVVAGEEPAPEQDPMQKLDESLKKLVSLSQEVQ